MQIRIGPSEMRVTRLRTVRVKSNSKESCKASRELLGD